MTKARLAIRVFVLLLLAVHIGLMLDSGRQNAAAVDETSHVAAGISHWQTGTHSMYRVNPPLPRMLAAVPVLLAHPNTWGIYPIDTPGERAEWSGGLEFTRENVGRHQQLVRLARLAGIGWTVLGGWLIYRWAGELYGVTAGCLGLGLWCFDPNVLAYGTFVLPDLPAAVAALAAGYVFWHYLRTPSWSWAWFAGLVLGIAQLTKLTLAVLYVVGPVLWLIHAGRRPGKAAGTVPLRIQLGHGFLIVVLSVFVLNLGYGFEKTGRPLGDIPFTSRLLAGDTVPGDARLPPGTSGNRFHGSGLGRLIVPLPEDYLRGIDVQRRDFEQLGKQVGSYLAGQWRETGWWYYYLYALAVKVPLGLWALLLWSLALTAFGKSGCDWRDEAAVWLPGLAVLVLVSSQTGFNHHMRYVLPILPFAVISASKVGCLLHLECGDASPLGVAGWPRSKAAVHPRTPKNLRAGLVVAALLLWVVASSLAVHPHSISYFNELAGGPDHGGEHLLDSNIDHGQDLLFFQRWLQGHPEARPIGLAYYGPLDPRLEGIDYTLPPSEPTPGYYALSVNYVYGSQLVQAPDGHGGWVSIGRNRYAYFRRWKPDAKAGYGLFIYHVTPEAAQAARQEMGLAPWLGAGVPRHE